MAVPTHLVLDLDGTLADSLPGILGSATRAAREVLPSVLLPDLRHHIGPPIREVFRRALNLDIASDRTILDALETAFRRDYNEEGWRDTVLYPGVHEVLTLCAARGGRALVLTNKPLHPARLILGHLGVLNRFDDVVTPDGAVPPHPTKVAAAHAMVAAHRLPPETTWLVGDSRDDLEAARECGFRFVAARFGYGDAWRIAPDTIATFAELGQLWE